MEVKKSVEPIWSSQGIDEHIQWFNFRWWVRQFSAGVKGPKGVVTIAATVIGLSCSICTIGCPVQAPVLGLLAGYFSVIQERGKIQSRKRGGIVGMVSALIVAFVQILVNEIIASFGLSAPLTSSYILSTPSESANLNVLEWVLILFVIPIVILISTGVFGYYAGYLGVAPEMIIERSKPFEIFHRNINESRDENFMKPIEDRHLVFISYSHKDRNWLDKIKTHLRVYEMKNLIELWDDTKIRTGEMWKREVEKALSSARIAVLLVSPDFLASEFIANHELPPLLEAAKRKGLRIIWIAVRDSLYKETEIAEYQAVNDPSKPLDSLRHSKQDEELVKISQKIKDAFESL